METKRRILVVDDTLENRKLMRVLLEKNSFEMIEAEDGSGGYDQAVAQSPDLILSDIVMPHTDGIQLLERLKANPETAEIPVIMLTGLSDGQVKLRCLEMGADDFLAKPFDRAELMARVRNLLKLKDLTAQLKMHSRLLEGELAEKLVQLERTSAAGHRFVPRKFIEYLGKSDLTAVRKGDWIESDMCILFADIRNFTSHAEAMRPEEVFVFINAYLGRVGPIIRAHHGFIDKYLGDGIMALFPKSARSAVDCAIEMQRAMIEFNLQRRGRNLPEVAIGIGINAGNLALGVIGESERLECTVLADAVNVASRIEGQTKNFGSQIIISEDVLTRLTGNTAYATRWLGKIPVKGKQIPVSMFEVLNGFDDEHRFPIQRKIPEFEKALNVYYDGTKEAALPLFQMLHGELPADRATAFYVKQLTMK